MRIIFISFCLLIFSYAVCQNDVTDSLYANLNEAIGDSAKYVAAKSLVIHFKNRQIDSSRKYVELGKGFAQSLSGREVHAMHFFEAELDFNSSIYEDAIQNYDKVIQYHEPLGNARDMAEAYNGKSLVYLYTGASDSVMHYSIKAMRLFEQLQDTLGLIQVYYKIGQLQAQTNNYNGAEEHLLRGLELAKAIDHSFYVPAGYNGLATTLMIQSNVVRDSSEERYLQLQEKSLDLYENALRGFEELGIDQYTGAAIHNIGLIQLTLEKWADAKNSFTRAMDLSRSYENPRQKASHESSLANALFMLGEFDRAEKMLLEGLQYYQENSDSEGIQSNLGRLKDLYDTKGEYKRALIYANELSAYREDIFEETKLRQIEELQVEYETEKKEQELALLNAQNEATALRLKASKRTSWGLGLVSLLFIGFAFLLWRLNKKVNSQKSAIEKTLNEKDTLLREIHHRVKNNLQVISSLLNLQSRHLTDEKAQIALKEGQNRVKSMALIHKRLYQGENLTSVQVGDYLSRLAQSLFTSYNVSPDLITLDLDIADLQVDVDTLIPLGLIINELISNSLKHAFPDGRKGKLYVSLKEEGNKLRLRVTDDGVGLDEHGHDKLESSFGYKLINTFSSQLDASISFETKQGTTVDLLITDYKVVS